MKMKPHATRVRLSVEAMRLWSWLAETSGISMTAKLAVAMREQAQREGVQ